MRLTGFKSVRIQNDVSEYLVEVTSFQQIESHAHVSRKIIFEYEGNEFVYHWESSNTQGLATVSKNGHLLYNPFSRNNSPEAYKMETISRELSILLRMSSSNDVTTSKPLKTEDLQAFAKNVYESQEHSFKNLHDQGTFCIAFVIAISQYKNLELK